MMDWRSQHLILHRSRVWTYVNVSLEGLLEVGADLGQDRSLSTSFWDILVLCEGQSRVLIRERGTYSSSG